MADNRQYLPKPYNVQLSPDDLTRYRGVLSAQQAEALRLRLDGQTFCRIGAALGVSDIRARTVVWRACWLIAGAKQQAEHPRTWYRDGGRGRATRAPSVPQPREPREQLAPLLLLDASPPQLARER